jgi:hypothetical protein
MFDSNVEAADWHLFAVIKDAEFFALRSVARATARVCSSVLMYSGMTSTKTNWLFAVKVGRLDDHPVLFGIKTASCGDA